MQVSQASGGSAALAALRLEEDSLRLRLDQVRARLKECVELVREIAAIERRIDKPHASERSAYRAEARDLEAKLDEARAARAERATLRIEEAALMTRLEKSRARMELRGIRNVSLPILENVAIASPCNVSWADMDGDADTRFCTHCEKYVYNLSMMSRHEAEAAFATATQNAGACVRLYRRTDGTVLTNDCPVGERHRFWRRTRGIAMAGLLLAALGAVAYSKLMCSAHVPMQSATMGAMAEFK